MLGCFSQMSKQNPHEESLINPGINQNATVIISNKNITARALQGRHGQGHPKQFLRWKRNLFLLKIQSLQSVNKWDVQQILQSPNKVNKMSGKYVDLRVYENFVRTYSRVPYLDREIFNVQNDALRLSRRADKRFSEAKQGIDKITGQSGYLEASLRDSRLKREQEQVKFIQEMENAHGACLENEKLVWSRYAQEREEKGLGHLKDQKYLDSLLKSTSTKADSRRTSVRRWN